MLCDSVWDRLFLCDGWVGLWPSSFVLAAFGARRVAPDEQAQCWVGQSEQSCSDWYIGCESIACNAWIGHRGIARHLHAPGAHTEHVWRYATADGDFWG